MNRIEAVIFDWAGTTVDYGCFAPVEAFIKAFEAFGITPTLEEVRKPMGMLKRDHVRTMLEMPRISKLWQDLHGAPFTNADVEDVYQKSESGILEILPRFAAPKPHVVETVDNLKKMGLKIGSTTGYTDTMMEIVVPRAKELGYQPDCWFSPNAVGNCGRPAPYMIFRNLEKLKIGDVNSVIKVGDTVSDILEGKHAGVLTAGILEGSSIMGFSEAEYASLTPAERAREDHRTEQAYRDAGADFILRDIRGLAELVRMV